MRISDVHLSSCDAIVRVKTLFSSPTGFLQLLGILHRQDNSARGAAATRRSIVRVVSVALVTARDQFRYGPPQIAGVVDWGGARRAPYPSEAGLAGSPPPIQFVIAKAVKG